VRAGFEFAFAFVVSSCKRPLYHDFSNLNFKARPTLPPTPSQTHENSRQALPPDEREFFRPSSTQKCVQAVHRSQNPCQYFSFISCNGSVLFHERSPFAPPPPLQACRRSRLARSLAPAHAPSSKLKTQRPPPASLKPTPPHLLCALRARKPWAALGPALPQTSITSRQAFKQPGRGERLRPAYRT